MINQIIIFGQIQDLSENNRIQKQKEFTDFNILVSNHFSESEKPFSLKCQIWKKHYLIFKKHIFKGNNLLIKGKLVAENNNQVIDVEDIIAV